jgi:hypothetical protein
VIEANPVQLWIFEVREDAESNEIERRALYSSSSATEANEWLNNYTKALGARGPDNKGRMWVTNPDDPEIRLFYVVDHDDGSAGRNLRWSIGVR